MLIVFDTSTGEILDNTGTNSVWPEGPPDDLAYVNTDAQGIDHDSLGLLRLHDVDDADLVAQALTHEAHVDPATGDLVIGDEFTPEPPPDVPAAPTVEEQLAALRAEVDALALDALLREMGLI
jgi:hypothetical protein